MCGIGGFSSNLNNLQIFEENLERVAQSMHHRGPDAKSTWLSDNKNYPDEEKKIILKILEIAGGLSSSTS